MIVVRIIGEMQMTERKRPSKPLFLDTRLFEDVPNIGDEISVGDGAERRTGKVVRIYQTNMQGDSLFAVEEPWVVLRFDDGL